MASNVGKAYEFLKRHPYKIREALQPRKMVRAGGWNAWSLPVAIYAVVVSVQLRRKANQHIVAMEDTNLQLAALEAELSASQRHLQNCRASLEHEQARLRVASDTIQRQVWASLETCPDVQLRGSAPRAREAVKAACVAALVEVDDRTAARSQQMNEMKIKGALVYLELDASINALLNISHAAKRDAIF